VERRESVEYTVTLDLSVGSVTRECKAGPVTSAGEVDQLVVAFHDITERREHQQELRAERRFIGQALDTLEDLFYVLDVDGRLQRWNDRLPEVTGRAESELDGMRVVELLPEDERESVAAGIERTLSEGDGTAETSVLGAEGGRIPFEFTAARLTDEDGTTTGIVGVGRDLTERRQREQRFQALVEESSDVISIVDADGQFRYQSPSLKRILGRDPADTIGDTAWEYIHPEDRGSVANAFEEWVENPEATYPIEYRASHADGSWRWMEGYGTDQLENPAVEGYVINSRDITERTERRRELERQNERLDEFASIVSHDLRNPLNVAEGHLELARETCNSRHLDLISAAIDRSLTLIEDLLTLAREDREVGDVEPVALEAIAERSWHTAETGAATLETEVTRTIRADDSRLQQLLENLYRNAVEHGSTGGGPGGDATVGRRDEDVTVVVGEMEGGFYVADDGPGITEADRGEVFEAGYSTIQGGTGLGLQIVEQVADAHGWAVTLTDGERGGARFEVTGVDVVD
jgi:PAS domain S-box-containing protein